jgi:hypothetical protein
MSVHVVVIARQRLRGFFFDPTYTMWVLRNGFLTCANARSVENSDNVLIVMIALYHWCNK